MTEHGLTLIAPLPVSDDDELGAVQFPIEKQHRSLSKLDKLLGENKRRKSSTRLSISSDDFTEATDISSDRGDESITFVSYNNETCSTTSTRARIEKEGTVSFFLSELSSIFAEPFSEESLMKQDYDYRDEQTVESAGETVESAGETVDTNEDDGESKYSLNFKAIPVKTNKSDLSAILGKFDRSISNVSKASPSSQNEEEPTERDEPESMPVNTDENKPKDVDIDPTMMEEKNQDAGVNEEKAISMESKKVEEEDHAKDDDEYSLNFHTIPTKPKRSDLSAIVARLDRRRSKDVPTSAPTEMEKHCDIDDKTVISCTKITVESTEVEAPMESNIVSSASLEASKENEFSDAMVQPTSEMAQEEIKEVEQAIVEETEGKATVPQDTEETSDESLSHSGTEYQSYACFALLWLCAATTITKERSLQCQTTHRALLMLDEDDKDIEIPSIECILEEACGTRKCMPKKRERVKVRAFGGNATGKKSGLVNVFLKLARKNKTSSSIQL